MLRADSAAGRPAPARLIVVVAALLLTAVVVLPVTVPRGYALAEGESARGAPGQGPVAAWVFDPVQAESGLARVQLYVAAPGRNGAPPEGVLALEADGREVWVIPAGEDAGRARSLELWGDVALTGDWESLEWIDEPLAR